MGHRQHTLDKPGVDPEKELDTNGAQREVEDERKKHSSSADKQKPKESLPPGFPTVELTNNSEQTITAQTKDANGLTVATYKNGDLITWNKDGTISREEEPSKGAKWDLQWQNGNLVHIEGDNKNGHVITNWQDGGYVTTVNGQAAPGFQPVEGAPNDRLITMNDFHFEEPPLQVSSTDLSDEQLNRMTTAFKNKDGDELRKFFIDTKADWETMSDRYNKATGKSLDEDTKALLGEYDYLTARTVNYQGNDAFPFKNLQSMNNMLPTPEEEKKAAEMFPATAAILGDGPVARIIANEVRFRWRLNDDGTYGRGKTEDYADFAYEHAGKTGVQVGCKIKGCDADYVSVGPGQMQIRNIERLTNQYPELKNMDATKPSDAPAFVTAYFDRYRKMFDDPNDKQFDLLMKQTRDAKNDGLANSLEWSRQYYRESKRTGDTKGMRNALLRTYNADAATNRDINQDQGSAYPNPYRQD